MKEQILSNKAAICIDVSHILDKPGRSLQSASIVIIRLWLSSVAANQWITPLNEQLRFGQKSIELTDGPPRSGTGK